ncbi:MAG: hypothetical protein ACYC9J_05745 [Sulfuricaulis sp.]
MEKTESSTLYVASIRAAFAISSIVIALMACGGGTETNSASVPVAGISAAAAAGSSCAAEPLRSTGTIHYFCSIGGSDSNNDGLSPGSPKASWNAAWSTLNTMPAGDTVALCRGGSWTVSDLGVLSNKNCTASNTCDFRDYGSSTSPRPILTGGSGDAVFEMGWYDDYSNSISGFRFFNLDINNVATTFGVFLIWGGVKDMDVCDVDVTKATAVAYTATNSTSKRISFRDSNYTHVGETGQGFLMACDNCSITNNNFDYTGGPTNRDHPIYVGSNSEPCTSGCNAPDSQYVSNLSAPLSGGLIKGGLGTFSVTQGMRIANNTFKHSSQSGGVCVSTIIVVHEPHNGLVIEYNLVQEDASLSSNGGCYGIGVGSGNDEPGYYTNLAIRGNKIFNAGNTNIALGSCEDCLVENNLIANAYFSAVAIKVPNYSQSTGVGPNLLNARTVVRNNTVYYGPGATGASNVNPGAIQVGAEGSGYVVTNNSIYYNSTSEYNGFGCFLFDLASGAYPDLSNNACYSLVKDYGNYSTYLNTNPIFVNPGTDPATANYSPTTGSPLLGAGTTSSYAPEDINGVERSSTAPTIGAYEK